MGFSQENPDPVSSLRLDYYLGLRLVFRVRSSLSLFSFAALFSFILSLFTSHCSYSFVSFVSTAKRKKKSEVLKVALVFLFARVEKPMHWRSWMLFSPKSQNCILRFAHLHW